MAQHINYIIAESHASGLSNHSLENKKQFDFSKTKSLEGEPDFSKMFI